jgi:site-specific DNA-cytosine methylase
MLSRNTSGGFSNSIDHAAAGYMALQPIALQDIRAVEKMQGGKGWNDDGTAYTIDTWATQGVAQPMAYTLSGGSNRGLHVNKAQVATCLDTNNASNEFREQSQNAQTLVAQPISFSGQMSVPQTDVDMTPTLQAKNPMAVAHSIGTDIYNGTITGDVAVPLTNRSDGTGTGPTVMQSMAVRRLTPKECERLQGFPDNYTDVQHKGKATPDGPRYKALGNSMAVPVMAWIGKRIQEVDAICQTQKQ